MVRHPRKAETMTLDLEAIKARAEAATKGPWIKHTPNEFYDSWIEGARIAGYRSQVALRISDPRDAHFIAHARTDVPALIVRIRELEAQLKHPEPSELAIINHFLVEVANECTCYGGGPYGHEPGCGYEPLVNLAEIDGYPGPAPLEAVRGLHTREVIAVHEGHGEEAWCPICKEHWPCPTIKALDGTP